MFLVQRKRPPSRPARHPVAFRAVGEKKTIVNIIGGTIGSLAVGDGSSSTGTATSSGSTTTPAGPPAHPTPVPSKGSRGAEDADVPIDFAILTAIEVERRAVCAAFGLGDDHRVRKGSRVYWRGKLPLKNGEAYELVVAQAPDAANIDAAILTNDLLHHWAPGAALLVGIAATTKPEEVKLGDVVVSSDVYYYERGKVTPTGTKPEPKMVPADATLWSNVTALPEWKAELPVERPGGGSDHPKLHFGVIASGEKVLADEAARDQIAAGHRKILAIEMEGYGFSKAVWQSFDRVRHLVIRGICDDGSPAKDDRWHGYAASAAAGFAKHLLLDRPLEPQPASDSGGIRGFRASPVDAGYRVDPDREHRLIQDLQSPDRQTVERAIDILKITKSPWLVDKLHAMVTGDDEHLGETALSALRTIPGIASASAIAKGLRSNFPSIRSRAAFTLGEMALFGRRDDAKRHLTSLFAATQDDSEGPANEAVHSIGKVGGEEGLHALLSVLRNPGASATMLASALHSPGRFWVSRKLGTAPYRDPTTRSDTDLYNRFLHEARTIVQKWSPEVRAAVARTSLFRYVDDRTRAMLSDIADPVSEPAEPSMKAAEVQVVRADPAPGSSGAAPGASSSDQQGQPGGPATRDLPDATKIEHFTAQQVVIGGQLGVNQAPGHEPIDEPLARLKLAQKRLKEHPDKSCPKCQKAALAFQDTYYDALDVVSRTWNCASCNYTNSAVGVPISAWPSDKQNTWYLKAAQQRARKQIIRCPTCGNESIDAKESGVVGVGTSEHVILSCKTSGCTFKEREVERSVIGTGKSLLRKGVLFVLVAVGMVLVGWLLRQVLTFTLPAWKTGSPGPPVAASAAGLSTASVAPAQVPSNAHKTSASPDGGATDNPRDANSEPVEESGLHTDLDLLRRQLRPVYFSHGSYELDETAVAKLNDYVALLRHATWSRLIIEGYAQPINPKANVALAERRTQAVRQYLAANGLELSRLFVISYGGERSALNANVRYDSRVGFVLE